MTTIRLPRNATRAAVALAGLGLVGGLAVTGAAAASSPDNHGCVTTSGGYQYDCATGVLTWDATVTIRDANDQAVLYDATTKPQRRTAGPVALPHGRGPGSVHLGLPAACKWQWDIYTGGTRFVAGHQGERKPCQSTTTTQPTGGSSTNSTTTTSSTTTSPTSSRTSTTTSPTSSTSTSTTSSSPTTTATDSSSTTTATSPTRSTAAPRSAVSAPTGTTTLTSATSAATTPAASELPRTGGDLWPLAIGLAAVFAGTMLVIWTRRQS